MQAPDATLAGAETRGLTDWISGSDEEHLQQRIHTKRERIMAVARPIRAILVKDGTRKLWGIAAIPGAAGIYIFLSRGVHEYRDGWINREVFEGMVSETRLYSVQNNRWVCTRNLIGIYPRAWQNVAQNPALNIDACAR